MQEIYLGLDIGTQFCSAAYVLKGEHRPRIIPLGDNEAEIPTEVCWNDDEKRVLVGFNAVEAVIKNWKLGGSVYKLCNNEYGNPSPDCSLKTLLRGFDSCAIEPERVYFTNGKKVQTKDLNEIIRTFLDELKTIIDRKLTDYYSKNYAIKSVCVAYPGTKNDDGGTTKEYSYQKQLESLVGELFGVQKIETPTEGQCAADLLKYIYEFKKKQNRNLKPPQVTCSIDIGAGTTDFSMAIWNQEDQSYHAEFYGAGNFGGKNVDKAMSDAKVRMFNASPWKILEWKKWMSDQGGGIKVSGMEPDDLYKKVQASTQDEFQNGCIKKIEGLLAKFFGEYNQCTYEITFVLMGGTSALRHIKEKIDIYLQSYKNKKEPRLSDCKIKKLEDLAKDMKVCEGQKDTNISITNSNFMAISAACRAFTNVCKGEGIEFGSLGQKDIGKEPLDVFEQHSKRVVIEPSLYSFDTYAILLADGSLEIIVDGNYTGNELYYLSNQIGMKPSNALFETYGQLFRIDIKQEKRLNGKVEISHDERDDWVVGKKDEWHALTKDDLIGYENGKIPNSQEKCFFYAIRVDNSQSGKNKLHMYLYQSDNPDKCYKAAEDKELSFHDFAFKVMEQEKARGIENNERYTLAKRLLREEDKRLTQKAREVAEEELQKEREEQERKAVEEERVKKKREEQERKEQERKVEEMRNARAKAKNRLKENYTECEKRISKIHFFRRKSLKRAYKTYCDKLSFCVDKIEIEILLDVACESLSKI